MYVVWNTDTGWSDESMRFATRGEADEWIAEQIDPSVFAIRREA